MDLRRSDALHNAPRHFHNGRNAFSQWQKRFDRHHCSEHRVRLRSFRSRHRPPVVPPRRDVGRLHRQSCRRARHGLGRPHSRLQQRMGAVGQRALKAVECQGKAVERQWNVKERQWKGSEMSRKSHWKGTASRPPMSAAASRQATASASRPCDGSADQHELEQNRRKPARQCPDGSHRGASSTCSSIEVPKFDQAFAYPGCPDNRTAARYSCSV